MQMHHIGVNGQDEKMTPVEDKVPTGQSDLGKGEGRAIFTRLKMGPGSGLTACVESMVHNCSLMASNVELNMLAPSIDC